MNWYRLIYLSFCKVHPLIIFCRRQSNRYNPERALEFKLKIKSIENWWLERIFWGFLSMGICCCLQNSKSSLDQWLNLCRQKLKRRYMASRQTEALWRIGIIIKSLHSICGSYVKGTTMRWMSEYTNAS